MTRKRDRVVKKLLEAIKRVHGATEPVYELLEFLDKGISVSSGQPVVIDPKMFDRIATLSVNAQKWPGPPPDQASHLRPEMLADPVTRASTIEQLRAYGDSRNKRQQALEASQVELRRDIAAWKAAQVKLERMEDTMSRYVDDPDVMAYFNDLQYGYFELSQLNIQINGLITDYERALERVDMVLLTERRENENYNAFMRDHVGEDRGQGGTRGSQPRRSSSSRSSGRVVAKKPAPPPSRPAHTSIPSGIDFGRIHREQEEQRNRREAAHREFMKRLLRANVEAEEKRRREAEAKRNRQAEEQRAEARRRQEQQRADAQSRLRETQKRARLEQQRRQLEHDRERRERMESQRREREERERRQRDTAEQVARQQRERDERERRERANRRDSNSGTTTIIVRP